MVRRLSWEVIQHVNLYSFWARVLGFPILWGFGKIPLQKNKLNEIVKLYSKNKWHSLLWTCPMTKLTESMHIRPVWFSRTPFPTPFSEYSIKLPDIVFSFSTVECSTDCALLSYCWLSGTWMDLETNFDHAECRDGCTRWCWRHPSYGGTVLGLLRFTDGCQAEDVETACYCLSCLFIVIQCVSWCVYCFPLIAQGVARVSLLLH